MLVGIVGTTVAGFALGIVKWHPVSYRLEDMTATAFHLDIRAALHLGGTFGAGLLEIVFVFLFVDLFDNVGTLVAVTKKAGLVNADGEIPRLNRILFADATATVAGSMLVLVRWSAISRARRVWLSAAEPALLRSSPACCS